MKPRDLRTARLAPAMALFAVVASGCGGYGEASPAAYDYATAMYSIANREAAAKLDSFATQVETATEAGELTAEEAGWLDAMVADARAGDWEAARSAARRLMEEQVQPGNSSAG